MARPRIELSPELLAEIKARTERGESAKTIHEATGRTVNLKLIERRQNEIKKPGQPGSPPRIPNTPIVDIPEDIPENTPVQKLDGWIKQVEVGMAKAEADNNLGALASLAARLVALAEARRKAMPLPKLDPEDNPDFKAIAQMGEERFLTLLKGLFRKQRDDARLQSP